MTRAEACRAIRAAGIAAELVIAKDETVDDEVWLNGSEDVIVQISVTGDGLRFTGCFGHGDGDDYGVTFGKMTSDPVCAAREALAFALVGG